MFWRPSHPVSDEQLNAYADGRVSTQERARVDEHLASCAPCRQALAELRTLSQALAGMERARVPRSFALREVDVRAAVPPRAAGLSAVMPALSGVTMAAFVAFAVLVGVDMSDGAGRGADGGRDVPDESILSGGLGGEESAEDGDTLPFDTGEEAADDAFRVTAATGNYLDRSTPPSHTPALPAVGPPPEETAPPTVGPVLDGTPSAAGPLEGDTLAPDAGLQPGEAPSAVATSTLAPSPLPATGVEPENTAQVVSAGTPVVTPPVNGAALPEEATPPEASPAAPETKTPVTLEPSEPDGGGDTVLRSAEIATAAVGLVAGGSLALAWWRRRT